MITKVLICPYFGDQPTWMDAYWANAERLRDQGYDFLLEDDEAAFRARVREKLGVEAPPMANTGKVWDYRPALGVLYADEIAGFDWWGHTDFDVVYGRVEEFTTEARLAGCDIFTDCAHGYIAGPWTLYRNHPVVNDLFTGVRGWRQHLESVEPTGWIEGVFTEYARKQVRLTVTGDHAYTQPELLRQEGDRLLHGDREVPFFHFRRSKRWPL